MPTTKISTRAADPGSSSRAFPWPVLETGNNSFPNGVYTVTCADQDAGKSFLLHHEIQGAPLIERWVEQGKLNFVCTVAAHAPCTARSTNLIHPNSRFLGNNKTSASTPCSRL